MMPPDIYSYIKGEESAFETEEIRVGDNWNWSFRNHVQIIFHLKNGVFYTGDNDWLRAFKNIMEPILNLSYWSEAIGRKDVEFYVENQTDRVYSFLLKKYHDEVFAKKNNLDALFDEITESDLDYGGVLVQKTDSAKPEVFQLNSVAFCDQTDMLGGPIAFKYNFSPGKLRGMAKSGWGDEKNGATISIEELIVLATAEKEPAGMEGQKKNRTTGKTIEVYILRGNLPYAYLDDGNDMEKHCNQLQIVAFYTDTDNNKQGVTLYRNEEEEGNIKFFSSKEVYERALGRGVGEMLLHPQVWTSFLTIHKMAMLEAGSKVPLYTDDENYTKRNEIQDMENLEVTTISAGKRIYQVPTAAVANIQLFEQAVNEWYTEGQLAGSAFDPLIGKQGPSGSTFRGQERTVSQGLGLHEHRRGKRAKFIEELYRDYIIQDMVKEILQGQKFLATLTNDEIAWVSARLAENYAFNAQKADVLNGNYAREKDLLTQEFIKEFQKKGNTHLLEILKKEFEDAEIKMGINIAGKQKDLIGMADSLTRMLQTVMGNPYMLQSKPIGDLFNKVVESMGLDPIDLSQLNIPPMPARRMTETINYADLATPPNDTQKQMLQLAGIETQNQPGAALPTK